MKVLMNMPCNQDPIFWVIALFGIGRKGIEVVRNQVGACSSEKTTPLKTLSNGVLPGVVEMGGLGKIAATATRKPWMVGPVTAGEGSRPLTGFFPDRLSRLFTDHFSNLEAADCPFLTSRTSRLARILIGSDSGGPDVSAGGAADGDL